MFSATTPDNLRRVLRYGEGAVPNPPPTDVVAKTPPRTDTLQSCSNDTTIPWAPLSPSVSLKRICLLFKNNK